MIGNTSSMVLTAGNMVRFRRKTAAAESTTLADHRDTFLAYLLPVKKHLYNFIRKALNFSHDADDIFQDTLLKGFRYFHSFDRRRNFKTWIFTIAHNLMKDAFQERSSQSNAVSLEEMGEIAGEDGQTGGIPDEVREIYAAAAKLNPRHREVFFLYYYNEFGVSEIAEIMGLSRANTKFILYQARNTIKEVMEVPA